LKAELALEAEFVVRNDGIWNASDHARRVWIAYEAGRRLDRDHATAAFGILLQHEHFLADFGEIGCRRQTIAASANYHYVGFLRHNYPFNDGGHSLGDLS
jgi:1,6-anhydro-N-acetylmuramate kinase